MSQVELLYIVGVLFGLLFGLVAVIYGIVRRDISKLEKWTRDKEQFDHQFRHDQYGPTITRINSDLWPLKQRVQSMDERIEELKDWKHQTVDAYIPRAIDEHERRIDRLDAKVFNGGGK